MIIQHIRDLIQDHFLQLKTWFLKIIHGLVIDLHRDALGNNSNYAPRVQIGEEVAAQLMFVIGTDGGGLEHSDWKNNLKTAIKIQEKANEMYPGFFKPIILRNSRYNYLSYTYV